MLLQCILVAHSMRGRSALSRYENPQAAAARNMEFAMTLPRMFSIRQEFEAPKLDDVAAETTRQLRAAIDAEQLKPGQTVAIAVGSRGIRNLSVIVRAVSDHVKACGAVPFIVPAMGSHAGATEEGQSALLYGMGIDPETVGCEVRATMETRVLGTSADGIPVHFDQHALQADHLIVVNRVKPHTRFAGKYQSGLLKMLLIGLGKRNGATIYHRATQTIAFDQLIETIIPTIFAHRGVLAGVAIVENARDETAEIHVIQQEAFLQRDPELLLRARSLMPRLPFDQVDLLIVDRIGKEISGTGMDTNIIGRKQGDKKAGPDEYPKVREIYVRGLTEQTHGNASGIGIAEYCHAQVLEQIDYEATRVNCLTAGHIPAAAVPAHFPSDLAALEAASTQAGLRTGETLRWMWIQDTLHLESVVCSEAYWDEAQSRDDMKILSEPVRLDFDAAGQLQQRW